MRLPGRDTARDSHHATALARLAARPRARCVLMLLAPRAHGAKGMEVAVQDDPIFVRRSSVAGYDGRDNGARLRARHRRDAGSASNVGWTSSLDATSAPQKKRAEEPAVQLAPLRRARSPPRPLWGIKPQFDLNGPAPALGDRQRQGAAPNRPKAKYYARLRRAPPPRHFKGRIDRYSVWNEPNYVGWIAPLESAGDDLPRALPRRLQGDQEGRPEGQGPHRRDVAVLDRLEAQDERDRAAGVPAPDDVLEQDVHQLASAPGSRPTATPTTRTTSRTSRPTSTPARTTSRSATLGNLTTRARPDARSRRRCATPQRRQARPLPDRVRLLPSGQARASPRSKRGKYLVQGFKIARKNTRVKQMLQYLIIEPGVGYKFFDTSLITEDGAQDADLRGAPAWAQNALKKGQISASRRSTRSCSRRQARRTRATRTRPRRRR